MKRSYIEILVNKVLPPALVTVGLIGLLMGMWGIGMCISVSLKLADSQLKLEPSTYRSLASFLANGIGFTFLGCLLFMIACLFPLTSFFKKFRVVKPVRPRLHEWKNDGFIMVATDTDYELAVQDEERNRLAFGGRKELPFPVRHIIFHEKPFRERMYSMEAYNFLTKGCVVVRSEMYVPCRPMSGKSLGIDQMCRLIYGTEKEIPEIPVSWIHHSK